MTNLELLDKLAERIAKRRAHTLPDPRNETHRASFEHGQDRGLFIALLEIADLKREIEAGEKPGN